MRKVFENRPQGSTTPPHWRSIPLKYLFRRSKSLGSGQEQLLSIYRDYGVIPKDSRDDNFNKASDDLSKYQLVSQGDLVVNKMKAWQGSVAVSEYDGIISPAYFVYRPVGEIDNRFAHYLLRSSEYFQYYASISSGVRPNQWDLNPHAFERLEVSFPPLKEQKLIAEYLDRETAEIDAMKDELDRAITLIEERFQAEIEQCFQSLEGTRMPLRSQIRRMATGTSVTAAKFTPAAGEPGVLATSAVFGDDLDETAVKSVEPHEYARLTCPLRINTLLVSRMNTMNLVGKAVTVDLHLPDVYLPDRLWEVEVEQPRYIYWWTRSQSYREQIRGLAVGASDSMKTLSQQAFRSITLPVPPVPQQIAVAAQLDEAAKHSNALKSELQEAKVLLKERQKALISAAVTGRLDASD